MVTTWAAGSKICNRRRKKMGNLPLNRTGQKRAEKWKHAKGGRRAHRNRGNLTKDNRTQSEHSEAEHNTPEQAVIVLCGTDPSASQQALHDEWAWRWLHPTPPLLLLLTCSLLSLSSLSPLLALLLSLPSPKPHSIQLLPSHKINLHSVHLVLVLCSDTMTYYSAQHTY